IAWRRKALRNGEDRHLLAVLPEPLELDQSVDQGEQGVVPPHADVPSRVHGGAPLAEDDRSGGHDLSAVRLDAEPFALAVPSVPGTADSLFIRHFLSLPPRIFSPTGSPGSKASCTPRGVPAPSRIPSAAWTCRR